MSGQSDQRCSYASPGQLSGRPDAFPRLRDWTRVGHDRRWSTRAHGVGSSALQGRKDLRGLPGPARLGAPGQKTLAKACCQGRGEIEGRPGGGLRGPGGGNNKKLKGVATRRAAREERKRLRGWLPAVGGSPTARAK